MSPRLSLKHTLQACVGQLAKKAEQSRASNNTANKACHAALRDALVHTSMLAQKQEKNAHTGKKQDKSVHMATAAGPPPLVHPATWASAPQLLAGTGPKQGYAACQQSPELFTPCRQHVYKREDTGEQASTSKTPA